MFNLWLKGIPNRYRRNNYAADRVDLRYGYANSHMQHVYAGTITDVQHDPIGQRTIRVIDDIVRFDSVSDSKRDEAIEKLSEGETASNLGIGFGIAGAIGGFCMIAGDMVTGGLITAGISVTAAIMGGVRSQQFSEEKEKWKCNLQTHINIRRTIPLDAGRYTYIYNQGSTLVGRYLTQVEATTIWRQDITRHAAEYYSSQNGGSFKQRINSVYRFISSNPLMLAYVTSFETGDRKGSSNGRAGRVQAIIDKYTSLKYDFDRSHALVRRACRGDVRASNSRYDMAQTTLDVFHTAGVTANAIADEFGSRDYRSRADRVVNQMLTDVAHGSATHAIAGAKSTEELNIRRGYDAEYNNLKNDFEQKVTELLPSIVDVYTGYANN